MNKDKAIKDLKERNNSLNNQYRLKEIRCVHLEQTTKDLKKEIKKLNGIIQIKQERIDKLNKKIIRRDNIIKKAMEYLKENACIDEDIGYFCDDLRYDDCKKLLDILKGNDKEL